MNRILLALLLLLFGPWAIAQPTVTTGLTLEEYVNDILLGTGVEAFNIQLTGAPEQIGHLTGAVDTPCPIEEGLVLSTALATNLGNEAPDDCFGGDVPFGSGVSGDADLLSIANSVPPLIGQNFNVSAVNDICAIEFDFVATGDTIKFNYTFGSNEYLTWVNSSFNDVFAFFLSGPGLSGPYNAPAGFPDGAINIAQLPDSDPPLPITISSVNNVLNEEFYIDNPFPNDGICQNGFTVTLVASSEVICGETYHIKLAIADGSDTALESVVVLEAGSFESNSVVDVDLTIDVGGPGADTFYEDCGVATLTFTRPIVSNLEIEEMIIIEYLGDAINGVDYTFLPDTIIFESGVQSVSFEVDAFEDGIDEGIEAVQFQILNLAACSGGGLISYFEFFIADEPDPLVVEGYETEMCEGALLTLEPIITGGYGNFIYEWSTGESTPTIDVSPPDTETFNVMVSDTCGMPSDDADILVDILVFPPLQATINSGDLTLNCNESVFISGSAVGGDGVYSYSWTNQDGGNLGSGTSLFYGTWQGAEQIIFTVTDGCTLVSSDTINVTLNVPELIVDVPELVEALCGEQFTIAPVVSGGQAPYSFTWTEGGTWLGWNQNLNYSSQQDTEVSVSVSDQCGQQENINITIVISSPDVEVVLPESLTGPCTEVFNLNPDIVGGSGGFLYTWLANGENYAGTMNTTWQSDEDAVLTLSVVDQCGAADEVDVDIFIVNPPLEIEIGEDINASCVDNTAIDVEILSGSGQYQYEWFVADTSFAITEDIVVQSFVTVPVGVQVTDGCGSSTFDELLYIIPDIPLELTLHPDTAICAGTGIVLTAEASGGEEGFFYEWNELGSFGTEQTIAPYNSANYSVTATDICGASITGSVYVEVQYLFSDFTVSNLGENSYQFFANPAPFCEQCIYAWDFGDGNFSDEADPLHTYDGLSDYTATLTVTNGIGCMNSASTILNGPVILYVPNAFTPNNDGINDVFRVQGSSLLRYNIKIFNRWGEMVFESDDVNEVWDGSHSGGSHYVQNEVYQYVIEVKGFDTDAQEFTGHISVMR